MSNNLKRPLIDKVTVHCSVGESGQKLINAEHILQTLTGQTPIRTIAKKTLPAFGIKKREPIGCKVTLRRKRANDFLEKALEITKHTLYESNFDDTGNFSFGIEEHTDFPGMSYDPEIGIFGMDVTVSLKRPGYRINRRKIKKRKIPSKQRITKSDAISFIKDEYKVEVK